MIASDPAPTFDPRLLGGDFECGSDGIWYARDREAISYPEEGNAACFEFEDQSFWFAHRGACLTAVVRRFPPIGALFDVGGGNGFVARTLMDAGFPTVLVEPGEVGARNARRRGLPAVICATLAAAKFTSGTLPAVGLFDVLEHLDNDADFLAEIHRCLVPGGRLYLTVPAFSWLWSDADVDAGHFRRCTLGGWQKRVEMAGFTTVFSSYFFSLLPLPLLALRVLPSLIGRRPPPQKEYARAHQPRARWLTDRIWATELNRLKNGRSIPFGSSCLLVVEKR
jgi:SAM-dependent methyltransferase